MDVDEDEREGRTPAASAPATGTGILRPTSSSVVDDTPGPHGGGGGGQRRVERTKSKVAFVMPEELAKLHK